MMDIQEIYRLYIQPLVYRHQIRRPFWRSLGFAAKGFLAITVLLQIGYLLDFSVIMAPFGASCILIFSRPRYDSSQPANVMGGYFIASVVSVTCIHFLPLEWWTVGFMLVVTATLMGMLRATHPPAGSVPLLLFFDPASATLDFIIFNSLTGSLILIMFGIILHKIPPQQLYPKRVPNVSTQIDLSNS